VNQNNANRLQKSFKKMRGAVLKIGQILSIQEESVIPPVIREAMERARSEADIMPKK
jgi:aarF domain-containing kinase